MVYLFGIFGFAFGFAFGLLLLNFLLRHKSKRELLENDSLKWQFGLLNWGLAILGAYVFVQIFQEYERLSM